MDENYDQKVDILGPKQYRNTPFLLLSEHSLPASRSEKVKSIRLQRAV